MYIVAELCDRIAGWIEYFQFNKCLIRVDCVTFFCISNCQVLYGLWMIGIKLQRSLKFLYGPVVIWLIAKDESKAKIGPHVHIIGLFDEGRCIPFLGFLKFLGIKIGIP